MVKFDYLTIHIPTRRTFRTNTFDAQLPRDRPLNEHEFLAMLRRWNNQDPDKWLYAPI